MIQIEVPDGSTKRMENKKRSWSDSSRRVKRWQERQGYRVVTFVDERTMERLKNEVKFRGKPLWRLLRYCVVYGFDPARQRGWWRN